MFHGLILIKFDIRLGKKMPSFIVNFITQKKRTLLRIRIEVEGSSNTKSERQDQSS